MKTYEEILESFKQRDPDGRAATVIAESKMLSDECFKKAYEMGVERGKPFGCIYLEDFQEGRAVGVAIRLANFDAEGKPTEAISEDIVLFTEEEDDEEGLTEA